MYRYRRVPFGIVCSRFLLSGTIKFPLKQFKSSVAQLISDNIYVNNVMLGDSSVKQAHEMYLEFKRTFSEISMNLREWISNSSEFMGLLPDPKHIMKDVVRVFGIMCNCWDDTLHIGGSDFNDQQSVLSGKY